MTHHEADNKMITSAYDYVDSRTAELESDIMSAILDAESLVLSALWLNLEQNFDQ